MEAAPNSRLWRRLQKLRKPYSIITVARRTRITNIDRLHLILKGRLLPNKAEARRLCAFFGLKPGSLRYHERKPGRPPRALPRQEVA